MTEPNNVSNRTSLGTDGLYTSVVNFGMGAKNPLVIDGSIIQMPTLDWWTAVGLGLVTGATRLLNHGFRENLSNNVETIWAQGGVAVMPAAATTFFLSSSSASDTGNFFELKLLNEDHVESTVFQAPTGQTPVAITGGTYLRVNFMTNASGLLPATSATKSVGDVYVSRVNDHTAGVPNNPADIITKLPVGFESKQDAIYTVPAGHSILLSSTRLATGSTKELNIEITFTPFGGVQFSPAPQSLTENSAMFAFIPPLLLGEKFDLIFRGKNTAGGAAPTCQIFTQFVLIDNATFRVPT